MNSIKQYVLGIVCSGLIVGIINGLSFQNAQLKGIMKMICGIAMTLAVLNPLLGIRFSNLFYVDAYLSTDVGALVTMGEQMSLEEEKNIISSRMETYILDKAKSLKADISVKITLDDERPYIPISVTVNGSLSPYVKSTLSYYMEQELGIGSEDQTWNSEN